MKLNISKNAILDGVYNMQHTQIFQKVNELTIFRFWRSKFITVLNVITDGQAISDGPMTLNPTLNFEVPQSLMLESEWLIQRVFWPHTLAWDQPGQFSAGRNSSIR